MEFRGEGIIITMVHARKSCPLSSLSSPRQRERERPFPHNILLKILYHDYITVQPIPGHGLRPQRSIFCRYRCKLSFVDSDLNSSAQEPTSLNQNSSNAISPADRYLPSFIDNLPLRRVIFMIRLPTCYLSIQVGSSEKK